VTMLRNACLSRQALDIFIALKNCAGSSRHVLASRCDPDSCKAALNQVANSGPARCNQF
jgi:hypothetical protein